MAPSSVIASASPSPSPRARMSRGSGGSCRRRWPSGQVNLFSARRARALSESARKVPARCRGGKYIRFVKEGAAVRRQAAELRGASRGRFERRFHSRFEIPSAGNKRSSSVARGDFSLPPHASTDSGGKKQASDEGKQKKLCFELPNDPRNRASADRWGNEACTERSLRFPNPPPPPAFRQPLSIIGHPCAGDTARGDISAKIRSTREGADPDATG